MATDFERLVVQLSADLRGYENAMKKAVGVTNSRARAIERRYATMQASVNSSFARLATGGIGAIAGALSVREVARYADAWTSAKNALAVAGTVGAEQAKVLDQIYESAQRNSTPLGALADLYGKAAQASDNLGASQSELLRFSDGVATSLRVAGTSAGAASGALQQLGQLIGSARVQAEEFNSVNEGARPILIAVANGLDKAGGSVNKLKQLVNDGQVSGRDFFDAFLKGLPAVETMAANSTQTIEQALTRINNAFTRYIGQTDESLGASQRLVQGLNALANDFDKFADVALKVSAVLAGAFVGRAIGGMIAAVPVAASAVVSLVTALRAGALAGATFSAAMGPIGLIAGIAAGAAVAFGAFSTSVADATAELAAQAASADAVSAMIEDAKRAQDAYRSAIANTAGAQTAASSSIVADTRREFEAKKALLELELKRQQALGAVGRANLANLSRQVTKNVAESMGGFGDGGMQAAIAAGAIRAPDSITGLSKTQAAIDSSPVMDEIKRVRAELDLTEVSANKLADALNTTFNDVGGGGGATAADAVSTAGGGGSKGGGKGGRTRKDELEKEIEQIKKRTAALQAETTAQAAINPLVDDYGYAVERASAMQDLLTAAQEAGLTVTPQLRAQIEQLSEAYAQAVVASAQLGESQDEIRQRADAMRDASREASQGIVQDLLEGRSAADAFAGALGRIGDRLLDMAFDGLFAKTGPIGGVGSGGGIFNLLGSLFGGFRATGGSVQAGKAYVVGERRPELFVPNRNGHIVPSIPRAGSAARAGNNVTISVDARGVQGDREIRQMVQAAVVAGMQQVERRVPGIVSNAQKRS